MKNKTLAVLSLILSLLALLISPLMAAQAQGPAPGKLVLWNKLGSQTEIENSEVGLDGTFGGGHFTGGLFGNAYIADHTEDMLVTFPYQVIPADAGTIEFWAKLTEFPSRIVDGGVGHNPYFLQLDDGYSRVQLGFEHNDGGGNGGLCAAIGHGFTAGTGGFGSSWTYEQVLGSGQEEEWHHYALVWDKDGIAGVDDGTKKVAVFLNGQLNSARWEDYFDGDSELVPFIGGELALLDNWASQGNTTIDDLIIWNYAKTDFSARFHSELVATSSSTDVYPGDAVAVDLVILRADDLYATQATCTVDPAILELQNGTFGDFFDLTHHLVGANQVDAPAGSWLGAISQQRPADPLSDGGLFAALAYEALSPGTTSVTCDPLFSDRDGFALPVSASGTDITVLPFGSISGTATYQGRLDHAGIVVTATGPVVSTASTDSAGNFVLGELKSGSYNIEADAASYLPSCATAEVASGETVTLDGTILAGGDLNDDVGIDIGDATLLTANFGLEVPPADSRADINGDGVVDVRDLAILGGNYELMGCQDW